jgi:hypothetical protein
MSIQYDIYIYKNIYTYIHIAPNSQVIFCSPRASLPTIGSGANCLKRPRLYMWEFFEKIVFGIKSGSFHSSETMTSVVPKFWLLLAFVLILLCCGVKRKGTKSTRLLDSSSDDAPEPASASTDVRPRGGGGSSTPPVN